MLGKQNLTKLKFRKFPSNSSVFPIVHRATTFFGVETKFIIENFFVLSRRKLTPLHKDEHSRVTCGFFRQQKTNPIQAQDPATL